MDKDERSHEDHTKAKPWVNFSNLANLEHLSIVAGNRIYGKGKFNKKLSD